MDKPEVVTRQYKILNLLDALDYLENKGYEGIRDRLLDGFFETRMNDRTYITLEPIGNHMTKEDREDLTTLRNEHNIPQDEEILLWIAW